MLDRYNLSIDTIEDTDTDLDNVEIIKKLLKINEELEIHTALPCTPENLMEVNDHGRSNYL